MVKARDAVTWFDSPESWRAWLAANHAREREVWAGIAKVHVDGGLKYQAAVDEGLCFGWIDGLTHSVDADGYAIRFTPRKPKSSWTEKNVGIAQRMIEEGRMHPSGLAVFEARKRDQA